MLCGASAISAGSYRSEASGQDVATSTSGLGASTVNQLLELTSQGPTDAPVLNPHPRLILTNERLAYIQEKIQTDEMAKTMAQMLLSHSNWILTQPVVPMPPPGPSGVLLAVRQAADYFLTTGLAYKLTGNQVYFERTRAEVLNFAGDGWKDWNPWQHTLDTGEASAAVSCA